MECIFLLIGQKKNQWIDRLLRDQGLGQEGQEQDQVLWCEVDNYSLRHRCLNPRKLVGLVTNVWLMEECEEEEQAPEFVEAGLLVESGGSWCV